MTFGVVKDAAHDAAHAMHRPPGLEGRVQPLLDGVRINVHKLHRAPTWHEVVLEIKRLFIPSGLGELIFAAKIAAFVKPSSFAKNGDVRRCAGWLGG